jgi:hypothetical protein
MCLSIFIEKKEFKKNNEKNMLKTWFFKNFIRNIAK